MPTIATSRAARRLHLGHREDARRAARRGHRHPAGHHQPDQHARGGRAGARRGGADMVSMARPLLADPDFVRKAAAGRADRINTCIACNQACLDHVFQNQIGLVPGQPARRATSASSSIRSDRTPQAHRGRRAPGRPGSPRPRRWPSAATRWTCSTPPTGSAGSSTGRSASRARRSSARRCATSSNRIEDTGVRLHLSARVERRGPRRAGRGRGRAGHRRHPARPAHPRPGRRRTCVSYVDVLAGGASVGQRVAIVGAGGIGFDVAEYLVVPAGRVTDAGRQGMAPGVGRRGPRRGPRRAGGRAVPEPPPGRSRCCSARRGKLGAGLGKTTGWIHRATLAAKGVTMLPGVNYERITPEGLVVTFGDRQRATSASSRWTRSCCAPARSRCASWSEGLVAAGIPVHVIGGADRAAELDAKRAIDQGTRVAAAI